MKGFHGKIIGKHNLNFIFALCRPGGIILLVVSWLITLYTLWQMVELHEAIPNKRFEKYHELGQEAFGPKLGLWIVVPLQVIVEVSLDIVYMVTVGESLQHIYILLGGHYKYALFVCIAAFAVVQMILSLLPNLGSISRISIIAAVMSVR
jgi:amino acid permease